jgi:AraC-like DNA-binding protein
MLEPLIEPLRRAGIAPGPVLLAAGLREKHLLSPTTRVSIDQILTVYWGIVAEMHDPMLAYRLGLACHVTNYGMYGLAMLSSADCGQALEIALQYHGLGAPLAQARLELEGPTARWLFAPIAHPRLFGAVYEFVIRLHVGMFTALYNDVLEDNLSQVRAGLSFHLPSGEAAVVGRLVGLELEETPGPESWICFDSARLRQPTRMGSPPVNRMALQICDEQIKALRRREGLAGRLRVILISNGCRVLSLEAAAQRLGMNERGLRRRLAEEKTTFLNVHDDVQLQAALKYLGSTELTVEAVARSLGFSDLVSFRAAFRRWTGDHSLEYRQRRHANARTAKRSSGAR